MKSIHAIFFINFLLLLGSCKEIPSPQKTALITMGDTLETKLPQTLPVSKVAFKRHLYYYFSLLPLESAEIFYTLPFEKIAQLYPPGREDSLSITIESLDLGNYSLDILLFKKSNKRDVICLIEHLQRNNKITFYAYNPSLKALEPADEILPYLPITDFLGDADESFGREEIPLEMMGNVPIYYSVRHSQALKAVLYTWMNPAFEGVGVPYDLILEWKNDTFLIKKIRRQLDETEEIDILGRVYGQREILLGQANSRSVELGFH